MLMPMVLEWDVDYSYISLYIVYIFLVLYLDTFFPFQFAFLKHIFNAFECIHKLKTLLIIFISTMSKDFMCKELPLFPAQHGPSVLDPDWD